MTDGSSGIAGEGNPVRRGSGPPLVLVHGGVGPEVTWERQGPLSKRWTLVIPARRGFVPGAPGERQDFEVDAADLSAVLGDRAHLVAFSYGGLGAALLAGREPDRVRSLTLVEVPLYRLGGSDPVVAELERLSDAFIAARSGPADPEVDERFLALAGVGPGSALDEAEIERLLRLARNLRPPREADPDVDAIRASGMPVMVVSGEHEPAIERLCDLVADALSARRERCPGAGHAVPRAPGFNELLESFLLASDPAG